MAQRARRARSDARATPWRWCWWRAPCCSTSRWRSRRSGRARACSRTSGTRSSRPTTSSCAVARASAAGARPRAGPLQPWSRLATADTVVVTGFDRPGHRPGPRGPRSDPGRRGRGRPARLALRRGVRLRPRRGPGRPPGHHPLGARRPVPRAASPTWSCSTRSCSSTTARCSAPAGCSPPPTCACTSSGSTTARPTPTTCPACWSARRSAPAARRSTGRLAPRRPAAPWPR